MLRLDSVRKTFNPGTANEVRALAGVDLTLEDGSFTVVIGTNGSGKSTLQGAISGAFALDAGRILLGSADAAVDITDWPEHHSSAAPSAPHGANCSRRSASASSTAWTTPSASSQAGSGSRSRCSWQRSPTQSCCCSTSIPRRSIRAAPSS